MKRFILPVACAAVLFYSVVSGGAYPGAVPAADAFIVICLAIPILAYASCRGDKDE